jgi:hypothetical protein
MSRFDQRQNNDLECDNCDQCERSRLEAESKCRGLHRWLSSNCHQVFIIVCWTSNTAFLPRILWFIWFIDVKQLVFSTFYCVSASFFFLTSPTHPLLKVNKTLSNLSGSRSRLYIRCNTVSGYFFSLDFWFSCPIRDYCLSTIHHARSSVRIFRGSDSQS